MAFFATLGLVVLYMAMAAYKIAKLPTERVVGKQPDTFSYVVELARGLAGRLTERAGAEPWPAARRGAWLERWLGCEGPGSRSTALAKIGWIGSDATGPAAARRLPSSREARGC